MLGAWTLGEDLNVKLKPQQTTNWSTGLFLAQASISKVSDVANSSAFRDMLWIH